MVVKLKKDLKIKNNNCKKFEQFQFKNIQFKNVTHMLIIWNYMDII